MAVRIAKLVKLLANTLGELRSHGARLAFRRQRWQHFHDIAHDEHGKRLAAEQKADQLRKVGQPKKAARQDRKAALHGRRAHHAHSKAIIEIGHVKALTAAQKNLATTRDDLKKRLAAARKKADRVTVKGDAVRGGTPEERLRVCTLASAHACSTGARKNFYSQSGPFDVSHCITGPPYGHRDDCSSWFVSNYHSCDLPDPGGQGYASDYTGTLGDHGKQISLAEATHSPGAANLYGDYPFHHVEMCIGDGTEHTIGHGSGPVDMGTFGLLPAPQSFRKYA